MKNQKHVFMLMGMFQEKEKIDDAGKREKIAGVISLSKQERMESSDKQKVDLGKAYSQFIYSNSKDSRIYEQSPGRE